MTEYPVSQCNDMIAAAIASTVKHHTIKLTR